MHEQTNKLKKMDAMKTNLLPIFTRKKSSTYRDVLISLFFISILLFFNLSCKDKNRVHPDPVELAWNFNPGHEGWNGDFADYPAGGDSLFELLFEHDTLPLPLDQNQRALKLSGNNINSDLFMFAKKRITSLDPNTVYYITFTIEFASNMPDNPDGHLVNVAAGAIPVEPIKLIGENNIYGMNIDKINQGRNGDDMIMLGSFANDTDQPVYSLKTLENEQPFRGTTNEKGDLWIIIGIDSGYAATTTVYLNTVKVELF
jgi:hypothetical protein